MSSVRRFTLATAALLMTVPVLASAQDGATSGSRVEFLVSSGGLIPTGAQKTAIRRGGMTAAQLAVPIRRALALTATLGWARSRDVAAPDTPKLDVFTGDVGVEGRITRWATGRCISVRPFAGVGAGVRSYNYRHLTADARHNLAAYGSVGGEIGVGRVSLRVEARDYVSGFRSLRDDDERATRNDVAVLAGLRIRLR